MVTSHNQYHDAKFDEFAGSYDLALEQGISATGENREFFARGRIQLLRSHLDRLGLRPAAVMEFGCGTGANVPLLLELIAPKSVVGVDVSSKSIEVARQSVNSPAARFALNSDYQPIGNIDLAFSCGVFHHIDPAERASAVTYVRESLKPGGIFALWENNPWNPGTRLVMRRIPFDRDAITLSSLEAGRLLKAGGFRVLSRRYLFIFPHFLRRLRALEVPLSGLPLGGQYQLLARKS